MNNLPKLLLRTSAVVAVSFGLVALAHAAANPKAGDRPNSKSSEPHPGDAPSGENKSRVAPAKNADQAALDRYDTNRNGKLDPDEAAAMQADKERPADKKRGKGRKAKT